MLSRYPLLVYNLAMFAISNPEMRLDWPQGWGGREGGRESTVLESYRILVLIGCVHR